MLPYLQPDFASPDVLAVLHEICYWQGTLRPARLGRKEPIAPGKPEPFRTALEDGLAGEDEHGMYLTRLGIATLAAYDDREELAEWIAKEAAWQKFHRNALKHQNSPQCSWRNYKRAKHQRRCGDEDSTLRRLCKYDCDNSNPPPIITTWAKSPTSRPVSIFESGSLGSVNGSPRSWMDIRTGQAWTPRADTRRLLADTVPDGRSRSNCWRS